MQPSGHWYKLPAIFGTQHDKSFMKMKHPLLLAIAVALFVLKYLCTSFISQLSDSVKLGRGHGSLTYHTTQFEWSDWLRSVNSIINIMIELIFNALSQIDWSPPPISWQHVSQIHLGPVSKLRMTPNPNILRNFKPVRPRFTIFVFMNTISGHVVIAW